MDNNKLNLNCPVCKTPIQWSKDFPSRPFCSERCKMIDPGAWSTEEHTIPGETSVEAIEAIMDAVDNGDIQGFE
jgi:endogenous inhibitor of DNA gyrase (YacG/DUF329 family)